MNQNWFDTFIFGVIKFIAIHPAKLLPVRNQFLHSRKIFMMNSNADFACSVIIANDLVFFTRITVPLVKRTNGHQPIKPADWNATQSTQELII
jgi:hypothetical protein